LTEIVIPGAAMGGASGLNDRGQVAVTSFDGTVTGIWQAGHFNPRHAPPTGHLVGASGITI